MATIRLRYVTTDRSEGITRHYLRLPGQPKRRLPGKPGDPIFMAAYQAGIAGLRAFVRPDGTAAKKHAGGTLAWLIDEYFRSANFRGLAPATQSARRNILKGVVASAGSTPLSDLTEDAIRQGRDRRADRPAAANTFLKTMRHLCGFAIEYKHMRKNPAIGVKKVRHKSSGHHPWTVAEVQQFIAQHPAGTTAHLALSIFLFTGLRISDVAPLGRQHVQGDRLRVTTKKNSAVIDIPILAPLRAAIDAIPDGKRGHLAFIINEWGRPFTVKGLGQRMRDWCDTAGLTHCSSHGLRKAGATIAADHGATTRQLMAVYGWSTEKEAEGYTKSADRRRLADEGAARIAAGWAETTNKIVPPPATLEDGRDNEPKKARNINVV